MVTVTRPSALVIGGDAERRAVGIGRVAGRHLPVALDVARAHQAGRGECRAHRPRSRTPRGLRRAPRRSAASSRPCRRRRSTANAQLHQREAPLELLAAVAHEARPVRGARHDLLERREHLAAIADAQSEGVGALEEALELLARARVIQDGFGPALARAEHVAVRESAAGHEAAEIRRASRGPESTSLMCTSCASKPTRSSTAAISTWLFTPCSRSTATFGRDLADEGRGDVLVRVEGQRHVEARRAAVAGRCEFLARAAGLVAQLAHAERGFRPGAAQVFPGFVDATRRRLDAHAHLARGRAERMRELAQPMAREGSPARPAACAASPAAPRPALR